MGNANPRLVTAHDDRVSAQVDLGPTRSCDFGQHAAVRAADGKKQVGTLYFEGLSEWRLARLQCDAVLQVSAMDRHP